MLALSMFGAVPLALAANDSATQTAVLHIDEGFLGHPVTLDLFDGDVRIAWDAGDVLAPGDLTVTRASATSVHVEWSTSYILGPRGIAIGFRQATSVSSFDTVSIEVKEPFGDWNAQTTQEKKGFISTRIGAESDVRLAVSALGMRQGTATWYRYKKCACAASPDFPKGTALLVRLRDRPDKMTVVRVNDFGPDRNLFPERVIDLDAVAFKQLSPLSAGVLRVIVEPLLPTDPRVPSALR